jgi:GTPase SAR1 family protein
MEQDGFYKVIVVGDYNVGKSAIVNRLCSDKFTEAYNVTVGVEYGSKEIEVDGEVVQLQIWDSVEKQLLGWPRQVQVPRQGFLCGSSGSVPDLLN